MASILQSFAVVSPQKPEQPKRNWHQKKSLAEDEKIATDVLLLELVHPLPSHHQETDNTNKIGDGHEDPTEVVALLNSSYPIPPVIPIHL